MRTRTLAIYLTGFVTATLLWALLPDGRRTPDRSAHAAAGAGTAARLEIPATIRSEHK